MSKLEYMVKEKMERLTTKKLVAYKKNLSKNEDKKDPKWVQACSDVEEVLQSRAK